MERTQVTVDYQENKPARIDTVLVSSQHEDNVNHDCVWALWKK